MANMQASAAVLAIMCMANLYGLIADKAEVKARNFVVSDTPAGKDQPEENFTPLTPEEWQAEYGLPADQ